MTDTLTTETSTETTQLAVSADVLRTALRALTPFTSKDSSTPILAAVHLVTDGVTLTASATDRYVLGRYETTMDDGASTDTEPKTERSVNLAVADAKTLVAMIGTRAWGYVDLSITDDNTVTATLPMAGAVTFRGVDGEFPRVDRLIPSADTEPNLTDRVGMTPENLAKVVTAGKSLGKGTVPVAFTFSGPTKPIRLTHGTDPRWTGLIMPARIA